MNTDTARRRLIAAWQRHCETSERITYAITTGQADPGEQLARMARHGLDSIREATEVYQACIAREGL